MNKAEIAQLLTIAAAIDPIALTEITVEAWHDAMGHLDVDDALMGLRLHRQSSAESVKPAHILGELRKARARHREIYGIHPEPPAGKRWAVDAIDDPLELES